MATDVNGTSRTSHEAAGRLTIGALSRATGIPVETLRTWETRYGFPEPDRKPSGHRLYPAVIVGRLRRVAEALARGHRASETVPASDDQLTALLGATPPAVVAASTPPAIDDPDVSRLMDAVSRFDADGLTRLLLADWARLGVIDFLERRVAPVVHGVGDAWSDGRLQIRHEHFLSERIGDLLRTLRLPFEHRAQGPLVVFATLPGEAHGLGLQMAALVVASSGCRVLYLGTDVPADQVAELAVDINARAVALSQSIATRGDTARTQLLDLRHRLPRRIDLVVGGAGADLDTPGLTRLTTFSGLQAWASQLLS
jgi:methanogenic corrinoid protein MtbC1